MKRRRATIRSTVDGPLLHTPGPGSLLDPVDLLCQLTGSQEVAAALWRVLAVRVWPASLEEAALEWLAWNDLEATLARLGPWLRSEPHRDGIWAVLVRAGELARPILLKLLEGDEADVRLACNVLVRAPMACAVDALARAAERWSDPIVALARDACLAQRSRVAVTDEAIAHARELAVTEVGPRLDGPVVRVEVAAGDRLILAANAGQVRVAERGRERFAIEGLHETFASLATDGSTLVVGDRLKIEIVPLDGGEPVAVSPDNGLHTALAVCGGRALTLCAYPLADTPLGLWTRDGSVHSHPIEGLPYDARLFAQGDRYLLYLDGGELSVRRIEDGATLHLLVPGAARVGPDREVRSMHLFDRDRRAATVTEDGTLRVFSTETGELLAEHRQRFVNAEVSLAFGQASPWLVVGVSTDDNDETEIHVFDRDGHPHGVIVERGEPLAARGDTALVADISDGRIWDLCTLKIAGRFTLPDEITAVAAGAEAFYAGDIEGLVWMIEAA
ncbi:MAG TPA: hypothetical protein VIL20_11140 [Sandaracinaceae bacterium]